VLDSTAFYSGFHSTLQGRYFTSHRIMEEIIHIQKYYSIIESLIISGRLVVLEPTRESQDLVKETAKQIGESDLSSGDISILALSHDLLGTIVTDDYAICNLASVMSISTINLSSKGITQIKKWRTYCRTCGKNYEPNLTECLICGNQLRRSFRRYHHK